MSDALPFKKCKKHGVLQDKDKYIDKQIKNEKIYNYIGCKICKKIKLIKWRELNPERNKLHYDKYRKNNKDKVMARQKLCYKKNYEHYLNKNRNRAKIKTEKLDNSYIKLLIKNRSNLSFKDISNEFVEEYRKLVLLRRHLKEIKHGTNNRE